MWVVLTYHEGHVEKVLASCFNQAIAAYAYGFLESQELLKDLSITSINDLEYRLSNEKDLWLLDEEGHGLLICKPTPIPSDVPV